MKQLLKKIFERTPLNPVLTRFTDWRRKKRMREAFWEWSGEDEKRYEFYKQFITIHSIAFDVGANMGNRAKVFTKLGARVVAIEPQSHCADFLHTVFARTPQFHLVRKALGASVGRAKMLLSNANTISSLSPDWVRAVKESGRFDEYEWNQTENVDVDTLDNLIAQYGQPVFVKIDVEGFEDQVVSGLSTPVAALSLEFTPEFMESTFKCIEHLCGIGEVKFQISIGESMKFALSEWVAADEVKDELARLDPKVFGDLYARFASLS